MLFFLGKNRLSCLIHYIRFIIWYHYTTTWLLLKVYSLLWYILYSCFIFFLGGYILSLIYLQHFLHGLVTINWNIWVIKNIFWSSSLICLTLIVFEWLWSWKHFTNWKWKLMLQKWKLSNHLYFPKNPC